jgi:hypothetical protein
MEIGFLPHIVGLPVKDKKEFPLFDYKRLLFHSLLKTGKSFNDKHLWVLKSTGLGITEFLESYFQRLPLTDLIQYRNCYPFISTIANSWE